MKIAIAQNFKIQTADKQDLLTGYMCVLPKFGETAYYINETEKLSSDSRIILDPIIQRLKAKAKGEPIEKLKNSSKFDKDEDFWVPNSMEEAPYVLQDTIGALNQAIAEYNKSSDVKWDRIFLMIGKFEEDDIIIKPTKLSAVTEDGVAIGDWYDSEANEDSDNKPYKPDVEDLRVEAAKIKKVIKELTGEDFDQPTCEEILKRLK